MAIEFTCTCGQTLQAPDDQAGGRVRCPRCNSELMVPSPMASGPRPGPYPPTPQYPTPYPAAGYYGPMPAAPRTSGSAVASLVLGIIGIVVCTPCGIFAVIYGHRALPEIDRSNGTIGGRGMAIAGLVLGYIAVAFLALAVVFLLIALAAKA